MVPNKKILPQKEESFSLADISAPFVLHKLGGGFAAACARGFDFSADAFELADFVRAGAGERVVDIGAGCGIISLLLAKNTACGVITACEIQPAGAALCRESVKVSGCAGRIVTVCADIRDLAELTAPAAYDLAVCNPPYYKTGAGKRPPDPRRAVARSELTLGPRTLCAAAARLLRPGGRLCVCYPPARLDDIEKAAAESGFGLTGIKRIANAGRAPRLVLLEYTAGASPRPGGNS